MVNETNLGKTALAALSRVVRQRFNFNNINAGITGFS
jgi:hypothetical protein